MENKWNKNEMSQIWLNSEMNSTHVLYPLHMYYIHLEQNCCFIFQTFESSSSLKLESWLTCTTPLLVFSPYEKLNRDILKI